MPFGQEYSDQKIPTRSELFGRIKKLEEENEWLRRQLSLSEKQNLEKRFLVARVELQQVKAKQMWEALSAGPVLEKSSDDAG